MARNSTDQAHRGISRLHGPKFHACYPQDYRKCVFSRDHLVPIFWCGQTCGNWKASGVAIRDEQHAS